MAEENTAALVEEKKSPKKLIIILVAVLLLLAGGGGAAYYFLVMKPADHAEDKSKGEHQDAKHSKGDTQEEEHAAKGESSSEESHDDSEEDHKKEPIYSEMVQPMIVNFPKGSGASLVQIALSFLADNEAALAAIKKHEPMVRNNLMMKINAQNPEFLKTKEGKEALRKIMLDESNAILEKMAPGKRVKEVFFTIFVMQ